MQEASSPLASAGWAAPKGWMEGEGDGEETAWSGARVSSPPGLRGSCGWWACPRHPENVPSHSFLCLPPRLQTGSQPSQGKGRGGKGIWEGRGGDAPASPHLGRDRSEWRKPCWPPSAGALCGLGAPPFTAPMAPGETELLHARHGRQGFPLGEVLPL